MRIMFISPHCLLDRSSGAALSMMTQLESLAKRGWECRALTGSVLDNKKRQNLQDALAPWGLNAIGDFGSVTVLGVQRNRVEHVVFPFSDTRRHYVTAVEELVFFNFAREQIKDWKPDIIYTYGGWLLERSILGLARDMGIASAFLLINPNYCDPSLFDMVDHILTPTRLLAENYSANLGIKCEVTGEFVDTYLTTTPGTGARMVTFVNPSPEKGATMFIEIAKQALDRTPSLRFLVVESRTTAAMLSEQLGIDWNSLPNISFIQQQSDMRLVYERTKVILYPSYWYEAAGRVIYEAQASGIPVIASSHGAIPESLAGGGFMFDIPERCRIDHTLFPATEEAAPWVDCLERLFNDPVFLADAVSRAFKASKTHNLEKRADSLDRRFREIIASLKV